MGYHVLLEIRQKKEPYLYGSHNVWLPEQGTILQHLGYFTTSVSTSWSGLCLHHAAEMRFRCAV